MMAVFNVQHVAYFVFQSQAIHLTVTPIECMVDDQTKKAFTDMMCYISGTYTKPMETSTPTALPQFQQYYQWVITILLIEAALFSIPARLWKAWEHGRIEQLCGKLNADVIDPDTEEYRKEKQRIINYLKLRNSRVHGSYV